MSIARLLLIVVCACAGAGMARAEPPAIMPPASLTPIGDAEQALARGDDRAAETLLSRIPGGSLDAIQLARVQILRAEIGLLRRQADTALRSLPPSSAHVPALSARIELLRGRAQFMAGDAPAAVRTLLARERSLRSADELADNRDQIWNGLVATPLSPSALARIADEEPIARGWLELAQVLQRGPTPEAVATWTQRNPGHPGTIKAAGVRQSTEATAGPAAFAPFVPAGNPGDGYALLLPLSGALAASGRAVREGFISAWFESPEPRPALRIYDTGKDAREAVLAYQAAVQDGARFIVGPLTRDGAAAIAANAAQSDGTGWLALNYLDRPAAGAIQFGLAPEDEARAAALDAISTGHRRALALAPDNDWGGRTLRAFTDSYTAQGGVVLQTAGYSPGTPDFGRPLRELLQLDRSRQRHQQLTAALGVTSEFEPRPRQDADLLFAPIRASEARSLVPQLGFFRASRLAAYTVSAAHGGHIGDGLEGVRLCDMPWVLDLNGRWAAARIRAQEIFADTMRDQPRLYALGVDAFGVAQALARGELDAGRELEGATGRLSLQADGRVQRGLSCRAIRSGRAAPDP